MVYVCAYEKRRPTDPSLVSGSNNLHQPLVPAHLLGDDPRRGDPPCPINRLATIVPLFSSGRMSTEMSWMWSSVPVLVDPTNPRPLRLSDSPLLGGGGASVGVGTRYPGPTPLPFPHPTHIRPSPLRNRSAYTPVYDRGSYNRLKMPCSGISVSPVFAISVSTMPYNGTRCACINNRSPSVGA